MERDKIKYTFQGGIRLKIGYDNQQGVYCIKIEYPEDTIFINANTISETKERFVEAMGALFETTICEQLKIEGEDNV